MKIGFLGAGKMAQGILSALPDKESVLMAHRTEEDIAVAQACDLLFLAVRPQQVAEVAAAIRPILTEHQVLVSIVAGKTLAKLAELFGSQVRLIRVMPNLALRAQAGMCVLCPAPNATPDDLAIVEKLLGGAGATAVLPEKDFDAVTALSGSGPAYFAYMEQAMAEGGVALGLSPEVARLLAEQTMYGTAKFLRESHADLEAFIQGVATKGGTTAAGMVHLAQPVFKEIVAKALAAAAQRSKELA